MVFDLLWLFVMAYFLNQYMLYNSEGRGDSMLKGGSPCRQKLENIVPGGFQVDMLLKDSSSAEWYFSATVINNLVHKVFPWKG